jgi:hypothetical protein
MNHRYPDVNFYLTTVVLDAADSNIFPLFVWTMRSSVWFAHHEFSRLEAAVVSGIQLAVLEDPSHARFISLLANNATPAHVARLNAMRQLGEIQVQHVPAMRRFVDDMDDPTKGKEELTQEYNNGIVSTEKVESTTVEYATRHVNGELGGQNVGLHPVDRMPEKRPVKGQITKKRKRLQKHVSQPERAVYAGRASCTVRPTKDAICWACKIHLKM